ncbi:MAG: outer membrane beta-barrel protein [Muribaculaceae bacterium]|nr:outer membrane beta-barrel protein [Muribaculaceae bacterium]
MKRFLILMLAAAAAAFGAKARQPETGYRGFIEWSNDYRTQKPFLGPDSHINTLYTGFSTSHGYQFNPWLFVGAGIEYEYCSKLKEHVFIPFVHGRVDMLFGKFTPFGEVRVGYNLVDNMGDKGFYFSPNIGYRFNWGRKVGINIGAGVSVLLNKVDSYDMVVDPNGYVMYHKVDSHYEKKAFFSFRIGIDF